MLISATPPARTFTPFLIAMRTFLRVVCLMFARRASASRSQIDDGCRFRTQPERAGGKSALFELWGSSQLMHNGGSMYICLIRKERARSSR